jgi:hypothetical protein
MTALLKDPALLVGLIRTAMILAVSFGIMLTDEQQAAVIGFAGALMAVLSIALSAVTRSLTTPVAAPVLPQGTQVEVITPEGQPNESVTL